MLQYETIFVTDPNFTDEEVDDLVKLLDQVTVAAGGKVLKVEKWGKRRLAYPIAHREEGIYVLMTLECPTQHVKEIDRRYRMNDRILRHLTVRVEDVRRFAVGDHLVVIGQAVTVAASHGGKPLLYFASGYHQIS